MKKRIGIFIFEDVDVMDFAGPFEVFSVTNQLNDYQLFDIQVISIKNEMIVAKNGLKITPDVAISEVKELDILILAGGDGTRAILKSKKVIDWISKVSSKAELVLSVCSGSLLLAKAGLLDKLQATTHHQVVDALKKLAPKTTITTGVRFVDNGKIVTSAGISAGLDMCFHIIKRLYGKKIAKKTAAYMEYTLTK
jgi:transcriptional regulator GlxA family with amidase domain